MATELVLLSEVPLHADLMADVAAQVLPGGSGISYRDGEITQFIDAEGATVVTIFDAVPVHDPVQAASMLADPPASFGLWTEISLPFGGPSNGRTLVTLLAEAVGGTIKAKR